MGRSDDTQQQQSELDPAAKKCSKGRYGDEIERRGRKEPKLLIEKADVAVSPGVGFGEHGEGFVRIALVENEHRIRQAARNIRRFLSEETDALHNVVAMNEKAAGNRP